jgi:hypothetical protein
MFVLAAILLASCNVFQTDTERGYQQNSQWNTAAVYTGANIRMVSQRAHPLTGVPVVCTEPSPDVAVALSTALQISAQGQSGAVGAGAALSGGSAEAVAELAGRSTALLGLRDGLYRACEAYANGIIGDDAYALVLSRYGQLMTTLFLGQDLSSAAGSEARATVASAALINLSGNAPAPPTPPPSPAPGAAAPAPGAVKPAAPAAAKPAAPAAAKPAGPQPPPAGSPAPGATPGATGSPSPADNGNAAALLQMNKDYMSLDADEFHLLLVACINENDATRVNYDKRPNTWLRGLCESMKPQLVQALGKIISAGKL